MKLSLKALVALERLAQHTTTSLGNAKRSKKKNTDKIGYQRQMQIIITNNNGTYVTEPINSVIVYLRGNEQEENPFDIDTKQSNGESVSESIFESEIERGGEAHIFCEIQN